LEFDPSKRAAAQAGRTLEIWIVWSLTPLLAETSQRLHRWNHLRIFWVQWTMSLDCSALFQQGEPERFQFQCRSLGSPFVSVLLLLSSFQTIGDAIFE
jgi:hypothetical protein